MHTRGVIVVTGAAGFIGSHIAGALMARGQNVVGIDDFDPYYPRPLKERNLVEAAEQAGAGGAGAGTLEFVEADITNDSEMGLLFDRVRPEGVIHLAARAGVRPSIANPAAYMRTNVVGTQIILEAARRAGCERIVVASSSSVYGNAAKVPFNEDDVGMPISPYAASKRACELQAHVHFALTKMPTACVRFFTVFGARQRPDLAISSFLRAVSTGAGLSMFGDGSTSRDYTFVDDIVSGVLAAYDRIDRFGYRVWNLGGSEPVSLCDMIATISKVVGRDAKVERKPMQPGDVERTCADISRAAAELSYRRTVSFEEGVRRQWAWMQKVGL